MITDYYLYDHGLPTIVSCHNSVALVCERTIAPYVMKFSYYFHSKGKAVPLQAWSGPEVSRKLRFPHFMTTAQGGQPYAPAAFTPRKFSWYSFLLEAESTPVP